MGITPTRHPARTCRLHADVQEEDLRRHNPSNGPRQDAGFSLVEVSVVILLISVVAGFALLNIEGIMPGLDANAALSQTVAELRRGRELAIAQRRNIELTFPTNNQIQLVRFDVPAGRTVIDTLTLANDMEFRLFGGVPDTPDAFGQGSAVYFNHASTMIFLSDGTLVDAEGNPLQGSVFIGLPDHPETARAVTILGATGRVRGYRWTGSSWIQ